MPFFARTKATSARNPPTITADQAPGNTSVRQRCDESRRQDVQRSDGDTTAARARCPPRPSLASPCRSSRRGRAGLPFGPAGSPGPSKSAHQRGGGPILRLSHVRNLRRIRPTAAGAASVSAAARSAGSAERRRVERRRRCVPRVRGGGPGEARQGKTDQGRATEVRQRVLPAERREIASHRADALALDRARDLLQAVRSFAEQVLLQRRALHLVGRGLEAPGSPGDLIGRLILGHFHLLDRRDYVIKAGNRRVAKVTQLTPAAAPASRAGWTRSVCGGLFVRRLWSSARLSQSRQPPSNAVLACPRQRCVTEDTEHHASNKSDPPSSRHRSQRRSGGDVPTSATGRQRGFWDGVSVSC